MIFVYNLSFEKGFKILLQALLLGNGSIWFGLNWETWFVADIWSKTNNIISFIHFELLPITNIWESKDFPVSQVQINTIFISGQ